jgi:predicted GNAT superfamily acetyltransferase
VSWLVATERVKKIINGSAGRTPFEHDNDTVSIEIPADINSLQQQTALKWREETRYAFMQAIKDGYVVVGFTRDNQAGRYLLRKS